jgi:hypothetical protein
MIDYKLIIKETLISVDESITIYRYNNGYMVEVPGRNKAEDWETLKLLVHSLEEVFEIIKEADKLPKR